MPCPISSGVLREGQAQGERFLARLAGLVKAHLASSRLANCPPDFT
jgi:hypothetical protein